MNTLPAESNFDRILSWYMDKDDKKPDLPDKLLQELKRWEQANLWLEEWGGSIKVVPLMTEKYGYSPATAYRDIANAKKLFSKQEDWDPKHNRHLLWQWGWKMMFECRTEKDYDSAAKFYRQLCVLNQKDGDPDIPDFSRNHFIQINIVADPASLGFKSTTDVDKMYEKYMTKKKKVIPIGSAE